MPVEVLKEVRLVGETFNYVKGAKKKKNTMGGGLKLTKKTQKKGLYTYLS